MKVTTTTKRLTLLSCLIALLFSLFAAACSVGGGNSSSNGPVDITLWANPAAAEVGNPPSNWFFIKDVHDKLNINLKVSLIPDGDEGNGDDDPQPREHVDRRECGRGNEQQDGTPHREVAS